VQDIALNWAREPGVGVDRIFQLVPFQRSASVAEEANPTAMHTVDEVHFTALSRFS